MVYAIKLLLAVLLLCAAAVPQLRKPFAGLFTSREYTRTWWLIVGSALVCFLAGKPLFVIAGVAVVALIATTFFGSDPKGRLAAFWLLILLFPPVNLSLEGFAGINRFIALSPPRVLSLLLLVPTALALAGDSRVKIPPAMRWLDVLVLSFPLLRLVTAAPSTELTVTIRSMVELIIDVLLPYYVTTRGIRSAADLKFVSARMGLGLAYLALVGLLESVLRKNVYSELQGVYGIQWQPQPRPDAWTVPARAGHHAPAHHHGVRHDLRPGSVGLAPRSGSDAGAARGGRSRWCFCWLCLPPGHEARC